MKWFWKNNNKNSDETKKTVKCLQCEKFFDPFAILVTKEGKSLCKNCFAKQEK